MFTVNHEIYDIFSFRIFHFNLYLSMLILKLWHSDINHIQMLCPTAGSMKEREVYKKVGRQVGQKNEGPGQFEVFIKHAPAIHGTDFDVIIEVYNAGREDTDAQLIVTSNAITYNSIHRGECQRKTTSLTVPAHKGKTMKRNYFAHTGICKHSLLLL